MNRIPEHFTQGWDSRQTSLVSHSDEDTLRLGQELAGQIKPPLCILLSGDLGMGKTVLVRGLARGLGVPEQEHIGSPSFTLINSYQGAYCRLHHVDLYRLDTLEEFNSIGLFDLLEAEAIVCVEWGEKVRAWISSGLEVRIEDLGGEDRRMILRCFDVTREVSALPQEQVLQ